MAELLAHRLLVEYAEHSVFAMHRGHDRHAEVDKAPLVAHAETTVLRHAALGNVELAHDLDAAQNRRMVLAGDGSKRHLEHAVDSVFDHNRVIVGLDVNVRGTAFESGEDG